MRKLTDLLLDILTMHLKILTKQLEGLNVEDYVRGYGDGEQDSANQIYNQLGLDTPYPERLKWN